METKNIRVALVHLGCARNLIDSESILGRLGAEGYLLTDRVEDAEVAVLNTCSFIGPAREESERAIRDLLDRKASGELRAVLIAGCLVERFRPEVESRFPGIDGLLGLSDYSQVARVVEEILRGRKLRPGVGGRPLNGTRSETVRLLQTPRSYAYLRPSHGCDHDCAFCIIPAIRGRQRSKELSTVLEEAEMLVGAGVREIVLVAEDSTGYGRDLPPGSPRLPELLAAIAEVPGLRWLRLMYAYPNRFPWAVTELMREHPRVLPYLDIPIQHISTRVLKRMRRGGDRSSVRSILERLRAEVPQITLRTTVLVGHPGEGREEFQELLDFLREFRFERLGAFVFSPEVGTPAGDDTDRCPLEEAEERLQELMELQAVIHAEHQRERVGRTLEVLIDGHEGLDAIGRSWADAPEVDGLVRIPDPEGKLETAMILPVRISAAEDYDLVGEVAESLPTR